MRYPRLKMALYRAACGLFVEYGQRLLVVTGLLMAVFCPGMDGVANDLLPEPQGRVILEVSGKIEKTNADSLARFDRAMLENFKQVTVRTETPWTDGVVTFKGPLLRDVLDELGAQGTVLKTKALNDYGVDIPVEDAHQYTVILALKMNDAHLRVRKKGPIWVIYPWDEHEELRSETFYSRSIWQLKSIVVE